jgi:hypothetical protein
VAVVESGKGILRARVDGAISGEVIVQAAARTRLTLDGITLKAPREAATGTFTIPFMPGKPIDIEGRG